jgi:hypothetical protein
MYRNLLIFLVLSGSVVTAKERSIQIENPRGGEMYVVGQRQTVVLNEKTISRSILIELSRDGGSTFEQLGTIDNPRKNHRKTLHLDWVVSLPSTSAAIVRATSTDAKYPGSNVSGMFSIGLFVDSSNPDGRYVLRAGDTMTGPLLLSGDPTLETGAATKQYVDTKQVRVTGTALPGQFVTGINQDGSVMSLAPGAASGITTNAGNSLIVALNDAATTISLPRAKVSASTSVPIANLTDVAIPYDSEEFDSNDIHDPAINTTRLTCRTAGLYLVTTWTEYFANGTGHRYSKLLLNGTTVLAGDSRPAPPAGYGTAMTITVLVQLQVGDYVETVVSQSSGGILDVNRASASMVKLP